MTQDDRMETIPDPAVIRATDEPDERTTPAPVGAAVALDLDAIEARVNAATPGPWWVEQVGDFGDKSAVIECVRWRGYLNTLHLGEDTPTAEFIAHAREDVPALVAEVRRLTEAENDAIRAHDDLEVKLAASMADADRLVTENGLWRERNGSWRTRAESAEAEVVTLRARLAAVEAIHGRTHWCFGGDDPDDLRDNIVFEPNTEWWPCPTFAALATTGEGQ